MEGEELLVVRVIQKVCMMTSVWYEGGEPGYAESRKREIDVKISQLKPSPFVIHFQVF